MTQLYDADLAVDDPGVVDVRPAIQAQAPVEQHAAAEKAPGSTVLGSNDSDDSTAVAAVDPNPNAAVAGAELAVASLAASTVNDVVVPDNEQQHSETTPLFYGRPSEDVKTWLGQFSSGEDTPVVARAFAALSPDIRDRLSRRATLRKENPEEWEWVVFARMVEKVVNDKRNEEKALEKIRNPVKPTGALAQFREDHPVAAVAAGVGIAVAAPIVAPMAMVGALHAVGFGAGGVAAGSLAAGLQVAMRGGFAIASSIGAGGAALAVAAPIASAGAAAVGVFGAAQLMPRSGDDGTVIDGAEKVKNKDAENAEAEAQKKTEVNANTSPLAPRSPATRQRRRHVARREPAPQASRRFANLVASQPLVFPPPSTTTPMEESKLEPAAPSSSTTSPPPRSTSNDPSIPISVDATEPEPAGVDVAETERTLAEEEILKDPAVAKRVREDLIKTMLCHKWHQDLHVPPADFGIPLRLVHVEDWNWHFEQVYKRKYGSRSADVGPLPPNLDGMDMVDASYTGNAPLARRDEAAARAVLGAMQGDLVPRVRDVLTEGKFERDWAEMEREAKLRLLIKALARGADVAGERSRADCPEMSAFGLVGDRTQDGEAGLVPLLKLFAERNDACVEDNVFFFPHAKSTLEMHPLLRTPPDDFLHAWGRLRVTKRSLFITATLAAVLDLHDNVKPKSYPRAFTDELPACFHCGVDAGAASSVLSKCSGCSYALYCSAACQKANWRAHKALCALAKKTNALAAGSKTSSGRKRSSDGMMFAELVAMERAISKLRLTKKASSATAELRRDSRQARHSDLGRYVNHHVKRPRVSDAGIFSSDTHRNASAVTAAVCAECAPVPSQGAPCFRLSPRRLHIPPFQAPAAAACRGDASASALRQLLDYFASKEWNDAQEHAFLLICYRILDPELIPTLPSSVNESLDRDAIATIRRVFPFLDVLVQIRFTPLEIGPYIWPRCFAWFKFFHENWLRFAEEPALESVVATPGLYSEFIVFASTFQQPRGGLSTDTPGFRIILLAAWKVALPQLPRGYLRSNLVNRLYHYTMEFQHDSPANVAELVEGSGGTLDTLAELCVSLLRTVSTRDELIPGPGPTRMADAIGYTVAFIMATDLTISPNPAERREMAAQNWVDTPVAEFAQSLLGAGIIPALVRTISVLLAEPVVPRDHAVGDALFRSLVFVERLLSANKGSRHHYAVVRAGIVPLLLTMASREYAHDIQPCVARLLGECLPLNSADWKVVRAFPTAIQHARGVLAQRACRKVSKDPNWTGFLSAAERAIEISETLDKDDAPKVGECDNLQCHATLPRRSLKRCSSCEAVQYCSKACQRADWKDGAHKADCRVFGQFFLSATVAPRFGTKTRNFLRATVQRDYRDRLVDICLDYVRFFRNPIASGPSQGVPLTVFDYTAQPFQVRVGGLRPGSELSVKKEEEGSLFEALGRFVVRAGASGGRVHAHVVKMWRDAELRWVFVPLRCASGVLFDSLRDLAGREEGRDEEEMRRTLLGFVETLSAEDIGRVWDSSGLEPALLPSFAVFSTYELSPSSSTTMSSRSRRRASTTRRLRTILLLLLIPLTLFLLSSRSNTFYPPGRSASRPLVPPSLTRGVDVALEWAWERVLRVVAGTALVMALVFLWLFVAGLGGALARCSCCGGVGRRRREALVLAESASGPEREKAEEQHKRSTSGKGGDATTSSTSLAAAAVEEGRVSIPAVPIPTLATPDVDVDSAFASAPGGSLNTSISLPTAFLSLVLCTAYMLLDLWLFDVLDREAFDEPLGYSLLAVAIHEGRGVAELGCVLVFGAVWVWWRERERYGQRERGRGRIRDAGLEDLDEEQKVGEGGDRDVDVDGEQAPPVRVVVSPPPPETAP
uniref:MYND-type domain-containing protein n=1 Tax=Mycena chlorophos TaxID=658473 RepID=A0ABQ0L8V3_MYCCL|nr:predicted protein [Mycena chlorophos]